MVDPSDPAAGAEVRARWLAFAADGTGATFARHTTDDVTLAGSGFLRPVRGRHDVWLTLLAAARITDRVEVTHAVTTGRRTYLEWNADALGLRTAGVTVVVVDAEDRLRLLTIDHRPLSAVLSFSVELRRRLVARMDPTFFYRSAGGGF